MLSTPQKPHIHVCIHVTVSGQWTACDWSGWRPAHGKTLLFEKMCDPEQWNVALAVGPAWTAYMYIYLYKAVYVNMGM